MLVSWTARRWEEIRGEEQSRLHLQTSRADIFTYETAFCGYFWDKKVQTLCEKKNEKGEQTRRIAEAGNERSAIRYATVYCCNAN